MECLSRELEIIDKLFEYYPETAHFLPYKEDFTFMTAVILSQSSTDKMAMRITDSILEHYGDIAALADCSLDEIEEIIKSAGLKKNKARGIKKLAEMKRDNLELPRDTAELTKLPAISIKSANCYLSFLGESAVIVDTHFFRASRRLSLTSSGTRDGVYREIKEKYESSIWSHLSYAVNALAREFCFSRNPSCISCPLSSLCPSKASFSE